MTLLIASILVDRVTEAEERSRRSWEAGADAVELRIDTFEDPPVALNAFLKAYRDRTWIVTCRSREEGGHFRGDTMDRVSSLIAAARDSGALVDFEFADFARSSNIAQKVRLAVGGSDGQTGRLILSAHDFHGVPSQGVEQTAAKIETVPGVAAVKVAYLANTIHDTFAALDAMHSMGERVCAIAMGEAGVWTRILAKKLGAFAGYAALDVEGATAPGQLTVDKMIRQYRWREITPATRVFGVIGDPVAQSISPQLFNAWFTETGFDGVYVPLLTRLDAANASGSENGGSVPRFLNACRSRPWLDIGGFSVTKPHKVAAFQFLGERADRTSQWIGAVNTITVQPDGFRGFNTDSYAALDSLCGALRCTRADLAGLTVDVLGNGGAARAVLSALREFGCRCTIYARNTDGLVELAEYFSARAAPWNERVSRTGEVLINCTSVGMSPAVHESPMPPESLHGCRLVFDLIYNPSQTRLLRDASARGAATLNGVDMFVRQAAMQFELWTRLRPSLERAREFVETRTSAK